MSKKLLAILIPVAAVAVAAAIVLILMFTVNGNPISIKDGIFSNNANYACPGIFDNYENSYAVTEKFLWTSKTSVNLNGEKKVILGDISYKLTDNGLLYLKNENLYYLTNEGEEKLSSKVQEFCVFKGDIYLLRQKDNDVFLYRYNFETGKNDKLSDINIFKLYTDNNNLYFLGFDNYLYAANDDFTKFTQKLTAEPRVNPYYSCISGGCYITYQNGEMIISIIPVTPKDLPESYAFTIDSKNGESGIAAFTSNGNYVYLSYKSSVGNSSDSNGLWKINLTSFSKEKISDKTYNSLYCYNNDNIIGFYNGTKYDIIK